MFRMRNLRFWFLVCVFFSVLQYQSECLTTRHATNKWGNYDRCAKFYQLKFQNLLFSTRNDDIGIEYQSSEQSINNTTQHRVDSTGLRERRKKKPIYRLEYSINFQRHVVKRQQKIGGNWSVVESFWWLDEAIASYPEARLMPIQIFRHSDFLIRNSFLVAGDVTNQSYQSYPLEYLDPDIENVDRIRSVLDATLKWYPGQVDALISKCPSLICFPSNTLEERIRFLLAPLPDKTILQLVNISDDIDWPKLLYNGTSPYGAGMSLSQVSHALQVLPDPFLLRYLPFSLSKEDIPASSSVVKPQDVAFLYEQTPSVVLQMMHTVLDLWIAGSGSYESIALAYLHWRGWEWQECRVMLHAFPGIIRCRLDPTWELLERGSWNVAGTTRSAVRKELISESLHYLQARLHLRPWHINSMLKTHPRLSGYSVTILKRNLNLLQDKLCLASVAVRSMILLMPSLLGSSAETLNTNICFWTNELGLELSDVQKIVTQMPSLLQYSVQNNMQPKLSFFLQSLSIEKQSLRSVTLRNPMLWGRSLNRFLVPVTESFCTYCDGMTITEFGQIVVKAPEILSFSWNGNLKLKLAFFESRLGLTRNDIKRIVQKSPRILFQSISSTLEPKIAMLEAVGSNIGVRELLVQNPSLLLNTKSMLHNRIGRVAEFGYAALHKTTGSKSIRRSRNVILVTDSNKLVFKNVQAAAVHAGASTSHMYRLLRSQSAVNGQMFVYADTTTTTEVSNSQHELQLSTQRQDKCQSIVDEQDTNQHSDSIARLTIRIAGAAFPPEDTVRGRRRAGGMALYVSSWTGVEWRQHCADLWKGWHVRLLPEGPTVILGYPFTRPSRPRCSLYACREAFRVAKEWHKDIDSEQSEITIVTESNYVLDLLQNVSKMESWGSVKSKNDIVIDGIEHYEANPDILHPLSYSFVKLMEGTNTRGESKREVIVNIRKSVFSDEFDKVRNGAQLAAKLMYDSVRQ